MFEGVLADALNDEHFELVAAVAALKGSEHFQARCRRFAKASDGIMSRLSAGDFCNTPLQAFLSPGWSAADDHLPPHKRRKAL